MNTLRNIFQLEDIYWIVVAVLALAGPVGWTIAGVALLINVFFFGKTKNAQKHIEDVFTIISERYVKSYNLAIIELNDRITRIVDESEKLKAAIEKIESFGLNYNIMSEAQQYELGPYINLMSSSTQLLVNPIKGIQHKYTEADCDEYINFTERNAQEELCKEHKSLIISLANFLYKIDLNNSDKRLLWKSLRKNKKLLKGMEVSKKEFNIEVIDAVLKALKYKYA